MLEIPQGSPTNSGNVSDKLEEGIHMDPIEQRLNNLWVRQTAPSNHFEPELEPEEFPHIMGVTVKEPMKIYGTMLVPGRYVFQLPDPRTQPNHVEIFNGDQTQLVANVILGVMNSSRDTWN